MARTTVLDETVIHDPEAGTYTVRSDWQHGGTPALSVVATVAAATDRDAEDLRSLSEVLDPDALNRVFGSDGKGPDRSPSRVSFRFEGCEVTVYPDGRTVVSTGDDDR